MHGELRPWVIRHQRPHRRNYRTGSAILPTTDGSTAAGLEFPETSALPFLLAARAQAVAAEDRNGAARPLFAYGIASSYEAFLRAQESAMPWTPTARKPTPQTVRSATPVEVALPDRVPREIKELFEAGQPARAAPKARRNRRASHRPVAVRSEVPHLLLVHPHHRRTPRRPAKPPRRNHREAGRPRARSRYRHCRRRT